MADYTTTGLLAQVRRRGMLPATSDALADDDLLAIATEELQSTVAALLTELHEEWLVTHKEESVSSSAYTFDIPERALFGVLRDVKVQEGDDWVSMNYVEPEDENSGVDGYKFQDSSIVIVPTPTGSDTIRLYYFRRPSALVATSACGKITAINTGTKTVTLDVFPATYTASVNYDFVKGTPHFKSLGDDQDASSVDAGAKTVTFTNALPTGLAVGDYLCLTGESPIPQIPVELHKYLVDQVIVRALEALGDPKVQIAQAASEITRRRVTDALMPRGRGRPRVIVNRNGPGFGKHTRRIWRT